MSLNWMAESRYIRGETYVSNLLAQRNEKFEVNF
jgi:hypothetical protein